MALYIHFILSNCVVSNEVRGVLLLTWFVTLNSKVGHRSIRRLPSQIFIIHIYPEGRGRIFLQRLVTAY